MRGPDLGLQQLSLVNLCEALHSPANISQALSENAIPHLFKFLSSENITCRQKSSELLKIVSSHAMGRAAILKDQAAIPQLTKSVKMH
jgi:hypothetical protein